MPRPSVNITDLGPRWWSPDEALSAQLLEELRSEAPSGHALDGVTVEAVAVKKLLKDVILWLPETEEWAAVHLTHKPESDHRWPSTTVAPTWRALLAEIL